MKHDSFTPIFAHTWTLKMGFPILTPFLQLSKHFMHPRVFRACIRHQWWNVQFFFFFLSLGLAEWNGWKGGSLFVDWWWIESLYVSCELHVCVTWDVLCVCVLWEGKQWLGRVCVCVTWSRVCVCICKICMCETCLCCAVMVCVCFCCVWNQWVCLSFVNIVCVYVRQ